MSKSRNIADLLDSSGDVKSGALDNVPASDDASSLTTGTIPIARIADDAVVADKLANSINTDIATGVTANTTANAALPKAGGTMTGNVSFVDSARARFGTGVDFEIYHDGNHSYIKDGGTGNLQIAGSTNVNIQKYDLSEYMAKFISDGGVELFYNNSKKIETTNTGVSVTGTLAATAVTGDGSGLTGTGSPSIDDNGNATAITIDASEQVGIGVTSPQELLHIKDGSIAVGNGTASNNTQIGRIGFSTDSANSRFIGMESYRGSDAANGDLRFHTYGGDSDAGERLRITNDGRGLSQFTAKAWCNFNGRSTVSIRDSHNVSSLSDGGTGFYTVYFSNSMANSNHVHFCSAQEDDSGSYGGDINEFGGLRRTPRVTSSVDLSCQRNMTDPVDPTYFMVIVFGD